MHQVSRTVDSITLSWSQPDQPNGVILDYELQYYEKVLRDLHGGHPQLLGRGGVQTLFKGVQWFFSRRLLLLHLVTWVTVAINPWGTVMVPVAQV